MLWERQGGGGHQAEQYGAKVKIKPQSRIPFRQPDPPQPPPPFPSLIPAVKLESSRPDTIVGNTGPPAQKRPKKKTSKRGLGGKQIQEHARKQLMSRVFSLSLSLSLFSLFSVFLASTGVTTATKQIQEHARKQLMSQVFSLSLLSLLSLLSFLSVFLASTGVTTATKQIQEYARKHLMSQLSVASTRT